MTKKHFRILTLFMCVLLLTGCTSINTDIVITDTKQKIAVTLAVSEKYFTDYKATEDEKAEDEYIAVIDKDEFYESLQERFEGWEFKKISKDGMYGYKITADGKNEIVKNYFDTNYSKTNSGIGYVYKFVIDVSDFFSNSNMVTEDASPSDSEEEAIRKEIQSMYTLSNLSLYTDELKSGNLEFTISVTMPGNLESATYYTDSTDSTVTIDYGEYAKTLDDDSLTSSIQDCTITSRKLGGTVLYCVLAIGGAGLLAILILIIRKIQRGPF